MFGCTPLPVGYQAVGRGTNTDMTSTNKKRAVSDVGDSYCKWLAASKL